MDSERIEFIAKIKALLSIEGIGTSKLLSLFSFFNSLDNILSANVNLLCKADNINTTLATRLLNAKHKVKDFIDSTYSEINNLNKINANIITFWDDNYPTILKKIYSPPLILYYIGKLELLNTNCIAIVGTRTPSSYGKLVTQNITQQLISLNITIVSGMARGIDSIAHQTTLNNNGNTIAVIGSGLDVIYPPENTNMFNNISNKGLILSEYPLGTKPDPQNFPKRNRIISGLSLGTVLVETRINGGAMQTANFALDQGREVFAIPGNITSTNSEGTNYLIQKGEAKLISNADDILAELNLNINSKLRNNNPSIELSIFEQKIFDKLSDSPIHIDILANETGFNTSDCLIQLLNLEFKGVVKQLPGKFFIKV